MSSELNTINVIFLDKSMGLRIANIVSFPYSEQGYEEASRIFFSMLISIGKECFDGGSLTEEAEELLKKGVYETEEEAVFIIPSSRLQDPKQEPVPDNIVPFPKKEW